jgi:hypothetical protein
MIDAPMMIAGVGWIMEYKYRRGLGNLKGI